MSPAVRNGDDTRANVRGDLDRHLNLSCGRSYQRFLAIVQAPPFGIYRVDLERAALFALHQHLDVVRPRVGRSQLPAAHQHRLPVAPSDYRCLQPRQIRDDRLWNEFDPARGGSENLIETGLEGAKVDTVGIVLQKLQ